jgi:hypothetical protein
MAKELADTLTVSERDGFVHVTFKEHVTGGTILELSPEAAKDFATMLLRKAIDAEAGVAARRIERHRSPHAKRVDAEIEKRVGKPRTTEAL